uniref:Calpain catalytic domain-containing protein n=1 Tax=Dunaliella tertiolecta TaxID=3047 RepID=A0A6S8JXE5_DUNTE|mmetsp:Transcript_20545/g.57273  ORF Transcript_20545/g.57273 Transcript_20545/m.57273 type:complete len:449 (-) Transcript_20545:636-1982(-)
MGAGMTFLKCLFSPIILPFQACRIYLCGCLGVYFERLGRCLCCGICICCNCTYKDKSFPANSRSIGRWQGKSAQQIDKEIKWKRIKDISAKGSHQGAKLFSGKVEPSDICQGQLGNCWLMSACACLANQEGAIEQVFLTKELTGYGKYKLQLYDGIKKKWQTVVVDDWIPCSATTGRPMFAKTNDDNAAWVLLLEKAMAKFKGSYAALDGGSTLWALEALTGDYVFKFKEEPSKKHAGLVWLRYDLVHPKKKDEEAMLAPTKDELSSNELFETMIFYKRRKSVLAASTGSGNDSQNTNGIVHGHAYAIVNVKQVDDFRMIQLMNPWGTFEWQGAWSDRSPLWRQHPKVARAVDHTAEDDGTFWMEFKDFQKYFKCLDFCMRTTGWEDLRINIYEDHPCCGPCWGCITGCSKFWCCCLGCRALLCAKKKQQFERAPQGCCAGCIAKYGS